MVGAKDQKPQQQSRLFIAAHGQQGPPKPRVVRDALAAPVWTKPILSGTLVATLAVRPRMRARVLKSRVSILT